MRDKNVYGLESPERLKDERFPDPVPNDFLSQRWWDVCHDCYVNVIGSTATTHQSHRTHCGLFGHVRSWQTSQQQNK